MMELLQTIWTTLNTENEWIITLISIPLSFLEAYIYMLLFTTILNIKSIKRQRLIYVLILAGCTITSRLILPSPYNTYFNIIVIILSSILIFKISFIKGLLALIIPLIISTIVELIFSRIYYILFNIDYMIGMNIPIHRFFGTLMLYFSIYIVYLIIKYLKINFEKIDITNNKNKYWLIATIILGIILIATQLYIIAFYTYVLPFFIIILSIVSIIAYVSISIYTLFTISKLETTTTNLEQAEKHNKTLEIMQDNTKAFRHDFSNIIQGMFGYIDTNDMEGLKKYYYQLSEDLQYNNKLSALSPSVVNNPAIYNVLAGKYLKANNLGIKVNVEVFLDLNTLNIKIYEFTRILGILMDNALEASNECKDKIINVTFKKDPRRNVQLLIIENTYKNKDVNTDKIFEKGFSSKEGNTGMGLWEVRQILKKNNNLNLYTTKNQNFFIQQFEIFLK